MLVANAAKTASLLLELSSLLLKAEGVLRVAHTDGTSIVVALTHTFDKELLDGANFIKSRIFRQIGIAKSARSQMLLYSIGTP